MQSRTCWLPHSYRCLCSCPAEWRLPPLVWCTRALASRPCHLQTCRVCVGATPLWWGERTCANSFSHHQNRLFHTYYSDCNCLHNSRLLRWSSLACAVQSVRCCQRSFVTWCWRWHGSCLPDPVPVLAAAPFVPPLSSLETYAGWKWNSWSGGWVTGQGV